jgi:hypothetical protein
VDQTKRIADRVLRRQGDRGLVDRVPGLDEVDDGLDHIEWDVLGQHREPTATSHRLGHPPTRDSRHVGHDHRDRRAETVGCGEVDVEAAGHRRQARHHEDIAVREVVRRCVVEEAHDWGGLVRVGDRFAG